MEEQWKTQAMTLFPAITIKRNNLVCASTQSEFGLY